VAVRGREEGRKKGEGGKEKRKRKRKMEKGKSREKEKEGERKRERASAPAPIAAGGRAWATSRRAVRDGTATRKKGRGTVGGKEMTER